MEENNSLKEKVILLQNDCNYKQSIINYLEKLLNNTTLARSEVTPPKEEPDNLAENEGNFNKFNQEETFNQNMMMSEDRASMDTNTVQKHGSNIQHFNNYQITSERSVNTLGLLSPQSSNQPFSQHKNHYELKELVYSNEEYQNVNTEEMLEKNQIDESFAQKYLSPMNQKKNMTILTSKEVNLENERNAALMSPTSDINVSKASSLKQEIDNLDNEIRHLQGKLKYMIENKKKE